MLPFLIIALVAMCLYRMQEYDQRGVAVLDDEDQ